MLSFRRRPREPAIPSARERVAAMVAAALGLPPDVLVKAGEVVCPDPACPGTETVVLVMAPGRATRALRIARPLAEVDEADVAAAAGAEGRAP